MVQLILEEEPIKQAKADRDRRGLYEGFLVDDDQSSEEHAQTSVWSEQSEIIVIKQQGGPLRTSWQRASNNIQTHSSQVGHMKVSVV